MKIKINLLLGAALCLLGTLTTTQAAGKGGGGGSSGGGGGGSTSEGTIYYLGLVPNGPSGNYTISMNADGSNKTAVGGRGWIFGHPSLNLHKNHRWFLYVASFTDQYAPDGAGRLELIALRDDYDPESNNTPQTISLLTNDPTLQQLGGKDWLLGDDFISFVARRWSSSDPDAIVVEGGIYVVPLAYDADGNIVGLGELPTTPTIPMPLVPEEYPQPGIESHPRPDVIHYSWAPTASMFVYTKQSDSYGVWVADIDGTETKISLHPGHNPQWSPDGNLIVYGVGGGFVSIRPNGKRLTWILQPTSDWEFYYAYFSPDSQNLVFTGISKLGDSNWDVFRMNANGGSLVNLTDTPNSREVTQKGLAAWR